MNDDARWQVRRLTAGLVGVVAMLAGLVLLIAPASAHTAYISGVPSVSCDDPSTFVIDWEAVSWNLDEPRGLHPAITVDIKVDDGDWVVIGTGAFRDEDDRRFSGTTTVPSTATSIVLRVTADPDVPWVESGFRGGTSMSEVPQPVDPDCGEVEPTSVARTPTPTATASPTVTAEPTPTATVEPTATATAEPTVEATPAVPVVVGPTAVPSATPIEVTGGPIPQTPTPGEGIVPEVKGTSIVRQELAETGAESWAFTIAGVALLVAGAMVTGTATRGRRH